MSQFPNSNSGYGGGKSPNRTNNKWTTESVPHRGNVKNERDRVTDLDEEMDPKAYARDLEQKNKLLTKWESYFPLEPPKPYDVSVQILSWQNISKTTSNIWQYKCFMNSFQTVEEKELLRIWSGRKRKTTSSKWWCTWTSFNCTPIAMAMWDNF